MLPDDSRSSNGLALSATSAMRVRISRAARKAAAPLKRKAEDAEKRLTKAVSALEKLDVDLSSPGLSSDEIQALMVKRGQTSAAIEQAELDWIEASEAYETATEGS